MAYKTKTLEKKAIAAIKKEALLFFDEIASYLPCSRATFYNHQLDKLDSIRDELEKNKVDIKSGLRIKWYQSDNPTLQIALMRLACTDDERRKLAMNYNEHTGKDGKDLYPQESLTDEQLAKFIAKHIQPVNGKSKTPVSSSN